jgi:hypothetical protein
MFSEQRSTKYITGMLRSETRNIFVDISKIFTASVEHQYRLKNVTFILIQTHGKGD